MSGSLLVRNAGRWFGRMVGNEFGVRPGRRLGRSVAQPLHAAAQGVSRTEFKRGRPSGRTKARSQAVGDSIRQIP